MSKKNKQIKEAVAKKEVGKIEDAKPKMRQIIIETDGTNANIIKSEASPLEMISIFNGLLQYFTNPKK